MSCRLPDTTSSLPCTVGLLPNMNCPPQLVGKWASPWALRPSIGLYNWFLMVSGGCNARNIHGPCFEAHAGRGLAEQIENLQTAAQQSSQVKGGKGRVL